MSDPRRMALRSRSRTATPTSGPGRGPVSDGRTHHRRTHPRRPHPRSGSGADVRRHDAPAEALRLRARALFPESNPEEGESGHGPPGADRAGDRSSRSDDGPPPDAPSDQAAPAPDRGGPAGTGLPARGAPAEWRHRAGLAARERMPLWLQSRCGLERRSVAALGVLLVVAAVFAVQHFWAGRTQPVRAPEAVRAVAPSAGGRGRKAGAESRSRRRPSRAARPGRRAPRARPEP